MFVPSQMAILDDIALYEDGTPSFMEVAHNQTTEDVRLGTLATGAFGLYVYGKAITAMTRGECGRVHTTAIDAQDTVSQATLKKVIGGRIETLTSLTAEAWRGGMAWIDDGTGQFQTYFIDDNDTTSLTLHHHPSQRFYTALAIADSDITLTQFFHFSVMAAAGFDDSISACVMPFADLGANDYGWFFVGGGQVMAAMDAAGHTPGEAVTVGVPTAGEMASVTTETIGLQQPWLMGAQVITPATAASDPAWVSVPLYSPTAHWASALNAVRGSI